MMQSTDMLLEVSIALSREKDESKLFSMILEAAMDITQCDGGTLYILSGRKLHFRLMRTRSMDIFRDSARDEIQLPPVSLSRKNVCAYAALEKQLVNIPDVYGDDDFDFSGPRNYDAITGYRTGSMLVVPMEDDYGDLIGVMQLINAEDAEGKTIAFNPAFESVVLALASLAAIRLTNMNYQQEIIGLLESFVRVISTAIDARSPYNANHTRNMALYAERFLDRTREEGWSMSTAQRREFLMSVWLHDIGKLAVPLEVMDKQSRLGPALERVMTRLDMMALLLRLNLLGGKATQKEYERSLAELEEMRECIVEADAAGFLPPETIERIQSWGESYYVDAKGSLAPCLTEDEIRALSIQRGTLTPEERGIMESHVTMTGKMLREMNFSRDSRHVTEWASMHHEYLNGSGYPDRLHGAEIPPQVRLLTILDIFDALTARDRPYKPPMPTEKALGILRSMAEEGKLDAEILRLFEKCQPWEEGERNQ